MFGGVCAVYREVLRGPHEYLTSVVLAKGRLCRRQAWASLVLVHLLAIITGPSTNRLRRQQRV